MAWEAIALPLGDTRTESHYIIGGVASQVAHITKEPAFAGSYKLLGGANAADGGTAVWALTLGDRLTVLGNALYRVLHRLLGLALYTICFDCHE